MLGSTSLASDRLDGDVAHIVILQCLQLVRNAARRLDVYRSLKALIVEIAVHVHANGIVPNHTAQQLLIVQSQRDFSAVASLFAGYLTQQRVAGPPGIL